MKTNSFSVERVKCATEDNENCVDVIFVHGLTGKSKRTWGAKKKISVNRTKWPFFFLRECLKEFWPIKLKNANVWIAGYPAPLLEVSHKGKIEQLFSEEGKAALAKLVDEKLGKNNPTTPLDSAYRFKAPAMCKVRPMVSPLYPGYQTEGFRNRIGS
jgi:hypothetical protein